jgi:hypothetical protein
MFKKFINNLPLLNFCVSSSAFMFQTRVLHPWHNELSNDIHKLQTQVASLRTFHNADLIELVKNSKFDK